MVRRTRGGSWNEGAGSDTAIDRPSVRTVAPPATLPATRHTLSRSAWSPARPSRSGWKLDMGPFLPRNHITRGGVARVGGSVVVCPVLLTYGIPLQTPGILALKVAVSGTGTSPKHNFLVAHIFRIFQTRQHLQFTRWHGPNHPTPGLGHERELLDPKVFLLRAAAQKPA